MAEVLHRIVYEASIDDAVDAAWRLANRTEAFRKQIRQHVIIVNIAAVLVVFVIWVYLSDIRTISQWLLVVFSLIIAYFVTTRVTRGALVTQSQKQQRKVALEQFGGKPTISSEIELRSDAVWVRQLGMEMVFPWKVCTGVQDNPDDIEMNFSPGICVIRNRHFPSPADRQKFLETAQRLAAK